MAVTILLVLALLGLCVVAVVLAMQMLRLRSLSATLDALTADAEDTPVALTGHASMPRLVIDVLNPIEVACANSRPARALVGVAPDLLRRRMAEIMARDLGDQLVEHGIQADIHVSRGK